VYMQVGVRDSAGIGRAASCVQGHVFCAYQGAPRHTSCP
jgi:hypothetical protein